MKFYFIMLISLFFIDKQCLASHEKFLDPNNYLYIAHGGGITDGEIRVSNSLEAMNRSYENGIRLIEIDFSWTTENELVAIHDWDGSLKAYFGLPPKRMSKLDFKSAKMLHGLTQMCIDDVVNWLRKYHDAYIVTDLKWGAEMSMEYIAKYFPEMKNRFIPQIYERAMYDTAKNLGFKEIIYTLYHSSETDKEVFDFSITHQLFAVTMPFSRVENTDLALKLSEKGVFVYTHTINQAHVYERLKKRGVKGIYTDVIYPSKV